MRAGSLLAAAIASLTFLGCPPTKITVQQSADLPKYRITSVAVLPFEYLSTPQMVQFTPPVFYDPPGAKRSNIYAPVPVPRGEPGREVSIVPPQAAVRVSQLLYEKLRAREGQRVVAPDDARPVVAEIKKESAELSEQELARKVATKLKVDAALIGRVLIWQERVGNKWGGEPAAVGFEVKLVAADGTVLWVGNYYEVQHPMNEDLVGFVERHGVLVTADQLAEYGASKLVKKFPAPARS